jgi:hypothetical protein
MSCKHYEAQLIEAGTGREATVRPALQAHLAACADCRSRYVAEQVLFASIDRELSLIANAEPSASFAPRMRAALQQARWSDNTARKWFAWWPQAAAITAVCVVAAVVMLQFRAIRRTAWPTAMSVVGPNDATPTPQSSAPTRAAPRAATPNIGTSNVASPSVAASRVARTDRLAPRTVAERSADEAFQAEILVPPDERDALASLIANLRRRQDDQVALAQPAIVPSSGAAESASLAQPADVPGQPLEIAELKVDPLRPAEEK